MIEAKGLTKFYFGVPAIQDVAFRVESGEIAGLLGLNGAGKSTILKILGSFLIPSAGDAWIQGISVDKQPQDVRRQIGYLPDSPPLYDEMTVRAYLQYVARLRDVPADRLAERLQDAVEKTHLGEVLDMRLGELSHGYRQRVSIAQAIIHNPKVLILDEPMNGLDPVQIVEMRELIVGLRKYHTVILSSHILSEITKTCDRIIIVDRGRVVAEGTEAELETQLIAKGRIVCDVERGAPDLRARLGAIPGVTEVLEEAPGSQGAAATRFVVRAKDDVRTKVAETIVSSGAGLLEMRREGAGLEGLFMQVVSSSDRPRTS